MGTASNQNQFNNTASIIDMMNKLDTQDYNRQQTAQQTEYTKEFANFQGALLYCGPSFLVTGPGIIKPLLSGVIACPYFLTGVKLKFSTAGKGLLSGLT